MERRFSMNDFEQSLKEQADEFKMIPSKRVWHGIYNDLHPGRRWPSISMSFLLIFTLVVIGHLNTHTGTQSNSAKVLISPKDMLGSLKPIEISKAVQRAIPQKNISSRPSGVNPTSSQPGNLKSNSKTITKNYPSNNELATNVLLTQNSAQNNIKLAPQSSSEEFENNSVLLSEIKDNPSKVGNTQNNQSINNIATNEIMKGIIPLNNSDNLKPVQQITFGRSSLKDVKFVSNKNPENEITTTNKPGELHKKPTVVKRKKNAKISWVYFAAPEVNIVSFGGEPIRPSPLMNAANPPSVAINQRNYKVLHNSAFGFEAGVQMNYSLIKKLSFTSGFHITYSGYNIISNEVHPTFANLLLKDPSTGNVYSKSYITHYGDGTGQTGVSIRNYNLQVSIPIGLQYTLLGSDKVHLNAAADFEPSLVVKSNAYMLSSDGRNYVSDPELLRKINMSSNFGLFVSFVSSKFNWQIGPNVRYQWLSTYKKDYSIQEHLIDYGIRIGISPIRK
ncbi:hypothetical protein FW778_05920 [Ginsengibacter hankyongi]|uniref:Outer membrane protein beta-barrel domain-containing protein n=1 Tax=Ginsengibacter hankyongi TaxID=2607284 RepID=A0A5J5IM05_9BACT|nr:hypothetical protein [Ginsengibacter hankyongi]KAA9041558.1 hypothetical protein FW778_05920 [Ginsengibacter hankyongi]